MVEPIRVKNDLAFQIKIVNTLLGSVNNSCPFFSFVKIKIYSNITTMVAKITKKTQNVPKDRNVSSCVKDEAEECVVVFKSSGEVEPVPLDEEQMGIAYFGSLLSMHVLVV
jgi:transposase